MNNQLNVKLEDTIGIKCERCHSEVFNEGLLLRSVSRFITGNAQDSIMPLQVFKCASCHHVNAQFMPVIPISSDSPSVEIVDESEEEVKPSVFTIVK